MISEDYTLPEVLNHLDVKACNYLEWTQVGMALKTEGYDVNEWIRWSALDSPDRYKPGECLKKWKSFNRNDVRAGTIIDLAIEKGWVPEQKGTGYALSWDSEIGGYNAKPKPAVDRNWLYVDDEIPQPREPWSPAEEVTRYLSALFEADEYVGICTETYQIGDTWKPTKGSYGRTAGELIHDIQHYGDDLGASIGDYKPAVGAWIRFNPLDGQGVSDKNVTSYRYALIESDSMSIQEQYAILKELQLPFRILVHSGKKSLHAIVRIDAGSYDEYRKRVDKLYKVCQENGLAVDKQNRNPSRLSRLPGIMRDGHPQYIVGENFGKASWEDWEDYIEGIEDNLPEIECWDDMPDEPLAPELIEGVLREGHKLLVSGPSKVGKSFLLLELAVCIGEGLPWLGMQCEKGRVLYVNLEIDRKSARKRIQDIRTAMGLSESSRNVDIWPLRGNAAPLDKLANKVVRKASQKGYKAIILDPIYKVITGDENSASDMATFCNMFDWISTKLGCAMIYCHHHSKGSQGQKSSIDRSSGSGVFARDPDAILDLIQLQMSEGKLEEVCMDRGDAVWIRLMDQKCSAWRGVPDLAGDYQKQVAYVRDQLGQSQLDEMTAAQKAAHDEFKDSTAFRMEATLREFAPKKPIYLWFKYPVHVLDQENILSKQHAAGERGTIENAREKNEQNEKEKARKFDEAYNNFLEENDGNPTLKDMAKLMGCSEKSVKRFVDKSLIYDFIQEEGNKPGHIYRALEDK